MKISLAFYLVVLVTITVIQFCASKIILKRENKENGTNIEVKEPGIMEVILTKHELTFEICTMKCNADFLVCYEPDPPGQNSTDFFTMCDKTCGFYVTGDIKITGGYNDSVCYMSHDDPPLQKDNVCDIATIKYNFTIRNPEENLYPSCNPKIENGLIKLNVLNASSDCPVTIKNAHFKRDPTTTTVLPSNNDPNKPDSPSGKSSSNVFGIFGWIFAFVSICVLH